MGGGTILGILCGEEGARGEGVAYHVVDDSDGVRDGAGLEAGRCEGLDQLVDGDVAPFVVVEVETLDFPGSGWGGVGRAQHGGSCARWGFVEGVAIGDWVSSGDVCCFRHLCGSLVGQVPKVRHIRTAPLKDQRRLKTSALQIWT